jgi:beta-xylosidase
MTRMHARHTATALVAAAALLAALAGCGGGAPEATPVPQSEGPQPVLDRNFPDPDVLEVDGTYFAFATEDDNKNVQVATSTDLRQWELLDQDALPELPSWIIPGKTWAPEVTEVTPGNFVMYFTSTNFQPTTQCIAVATATDPAGPYTVVGDQMLVCTPEEGGAIDATTFRDDAGLHLVWKNDGNSRQLDTWIQTAPLSQDGLSIAGPTEKLLQQTEEWEGELIEAPTVIEHDGSLFMFYSANSYSNDLYAIGLATATALGGPWEKVDGPWLSTQDTGILGPGGQDLVSTPDGDVLVFHGWDPAFSQRGLFVLPVEWKDGLPVAVVD